MRNPLVPLMLIGVLGLTACNSILLGGEGILICDFLHNMG